MRQQTLFTEQTMPEHKRPRALRIDPALDDTLIAYAADQERTISWVMERAVRDFLALHAHGIEGTCTKAPQPAGPLVASTRAYLRDKHERRAG
jgi:hypothetical protein